MLKEDFSRGDTVGKDWANLCLMAGKTLPEGARHTFNTFTFIGGTGN
jgi:hypothetical protein